MKEDKRPNQQPGLYDISYARYSEKRFTQIIIKLNLYVDIPLRGTNMAARNQQKHLFLSFHTTA